MASAYCRSRMPETLPQVLADFDKIAVRIAEIDRHHRTARPDAFHRSQFEYNAIGLETGSDFIKRSFGDQAEIA